MGRQTEKELALVGPMGGVNTRVGSTKLKPGEYAMIRNAELVSDLGIWSLRKGTDFIGESTLGAGAIRGGVRWYRGATPTAETVYGHTTKLYKNPETPSEIGAGYTTGKEWYFTSYSDYLYCTNGTDAVQRWDGTTMKAAGFPAPGSTPTVAVGAAGVLTGAYSYKVTLVYDSDASHESSASTATATINPAAQKGELTVIPTGGTGCTSRRIYRTKAGGSLYYFLATISDNTTTVYSDNSADAALGANQAPTDNGVPPTGQFIIVHRGRCYLARSVANRTRIFVSASASTERNPAGTLTVHGAGIEIFPADHYIDIGDDNAAITGLAVWGDALVVFKETEIYLVIAGNSASDFDVKNTGNAIGCIAPRSIVNMGLDDGIFFVGRTETTPSVYQFAGGEAKCVTDAIEPTLRANLIGLGSSYSVQPAGGKYRGQYLLSYAYVSTPLYEIAKFDTRTKRWTWDRAATLKPSCWIPYVGAGDLGEMYFGHATHGHVCKWASGGSDVDVTNTANQTEPQLYFETEWMDLGDPHTVKQMKWIYLTAEANSLATITIERRYNFKTSGTNSGASAKSMAATFTGSQLYILRVECEQQDATTEVESGVYVKLCITIDVTPALATVNEEGGAWPGHEVGTHIHTTFAAVRIHDIVLHYIDLPPSAHDQT